MAKKPIDTPFSDACYKPSSGKSELTFEGSAKFASEDFKINGQPVVTLVGEGELDSFLKNPGK